MELSFPNVVSWADMGRQFPEVLSSLKLLATGLGAAQHLPGSSLCSHLIHYFFAIGQFTYDLYARIIHVRVSNCPAVTNGSYLLLLYTKSQKVTSTFPILV